MKIRRKTVIILAVTAILVFLAADYLHVSGKEFPWAELASDEAVITVEEDYKASGKILATHTLTRGQGAALQSLLFRTHYLRYLPDTLRLEDGSNPYRIFIRMTEPAEDFSLSLSKGLNGWYLSGTGTGGWLKILDPNWEAAFQGILAATSW